MLSNVTGEGYRGAPDPAGPATGDVRGFQAVITVEQWVQALPAEP
jgi:hypothetical protein